MSADQHQLYHAYSVIEDREHTNAHYERAPEFFTTITGGRWNVYSCNLWDADVRDDTTSQERKLDLIARLAGLRPGMRLLDVGCGWGGPLTYLCARYGLEGVGLTLSPSQHGVAAERIRRDGAGAEVRLAHWQDYEPGARFDVVFTDEVIVHFHDLGAFFEKCHAMLAPGGVMVNKELHLKHPRFSVLQRGGQHVSERFGDTGNYRTLADELALAGAAGFDVELVHHIEQAHYEATLNAWLHNMHVARERLIGLVGADEYRAFRTYLKLGHRILRNVTCDVVVCRAV